jgi:hypothetical protein
MSLIKIDNTNKMSTQYSSVRCHNRFYGPSKIHKTHNNNNATEKGNPEVI